MSDGLEPLILDLLEWLAQQPREYADVMNAWRTSCPRLPVWEDANDRGYIARLRAPSNDAQDPHGCVSLTQTGRAFLRQHRPETLADTT